MMAVWKNMLIWILMYVLTTPLLVKESICSDGVVTQDIANKADTTKPDRVVTEEIANKTETTQQDGVVTEEIANKTDTTQQDGVVTKDIANTTDTTQQDGVVTKDIANTTCTAQQDGVVTKDIANKTGTAQQVGVVTKDIANKADTTQQDGVVTQDIANKADTTQQDKQSKTRTEVNGQVGQNTHEVMAPSNRTANEHMKQVNVLTTNMPANPDSKIEDATMKQGDGKEDVDVDNTLNITDIRSILPALMARYCPDSNVCQDDSADVLSENMYSPSCCRACSCAQNCQLTRTCCFPSPDNDIKHSSCYSSVTPDGDDSEHFGYKSYMMVDSEQFYSSKTTNLTCGNTSVAPWGSINPVYSKSHRKIYKNSICAAAYGVKDPTPWTARIACRNELMLVRIDLSSSKTFDRRCDVWFEYPGDLSDLEDQRCFLEHVVSYCPETFSMGTSMQSDQVLMECERGLLSPYRGVHGTLYRNVLCSVCNGGYINLSCSSDDIQTRRKRAFTALIDHTILKMFNKPYLHKQACLVKDETLIESTCRPVKCPPGQMYSVDGGCEFILKTWYRPMAKVSLQLLSDAELNTTGLTINSFQSTWLQHWEIVKFYYFPTMATQPVLTDRIIVKLERRFQRIIPKLFTSNFLNKLKTEEWTVITTNGSLPLKADLMDERYNDNMYGKEHIRREINDTRNLEIIYDRGHTDVNAVYSTIDQMTFCEMVDLTQDEFRVDNEILYINFTSEYLIPSQYSYPDVGDFTIVRVCIEQSGLTRVRNGTDSPFLTLCMLIICAFISHYI